MAFSPALVAALSSTALRTGAFIFLRWIPGHHFPPIIVGSFIAYLACICLYSDAFFDNSSAAVQVESNGTAEKEEANGVDQAAKKTVIETQTDNEPIFNEDEKSFLRTVFLGIPNWKNEGYSYLTIGINVLLTLFALDLVLRAPLLHPSNDLRFSRVGFVDSHSAKVLFREPATSQLPVYVYLAPQETLNWVTVDRIYYLDADTDYTYPVTFSGLKPAISYVYSFSNNLTGTFTTSPNPGSAESGKLTFLTSSCIKANFPYSPLSHSLEIPGLARLSKIYESLPSPASFMLFLGDFIYVDVPLRLSSTISHYRSEYRRVYASPSWSLPGISSVPWLHTLDDHEIANDWASGNDTDPFPAASDPFIHYHVSVNPPTPPSTPAAVSTENTTYFQFSNGPASFFMLDTRRYRTAPEHSTHSKSTVQHTILGRTQLHALLNFLASPEPGHVHWKIIASSVPFTKNWRFGTADSWGGFLAERAEVLSAMHAAEARFGVRVVVLSGDRHEFAAVRFPPPLAPSPSTSDRNSTTPSQQYSPLPSSGPHEFSVGPLSMFYLPLRTFKQVDDEDVAIKYLPEGNSKIGVVDIQNLEGEGGQKSLLKYSLWVDGRVRWEYTLTSPGPGYVRRGWGGGLLDGLLFEGLFTGWGKNGSGRNDSG